MCVEGVHFTFSFDSGDKNKLCLPFPSIETFHASILYQTDFSQTCMKHKEHLFSLIKYLRRLMVCLFIFSVLFFAYGHPEI